MTTMRPKHTAEEVKEAIERIRTLYKIGSENLKQRPDRAKYADDEAGKDARAVGLDRNLLRAARRFADPTAGYSPAELDEMIKLCQQNRFAMGRSMLVRLLTIRPKGRRAKLQERVIKGAWSQARLEAEITKQYGPRRAGGRRRRVPTEPIDLLVQIERRSESWRRWHAELRRAPDGGGAAPDQKLPPEIMRLLNRLGRDIDVLHGMVERALGSERPGRRTRADALGSAAARR